jgi:hypothetical protein
MGPHKIFETGDDEELRRNLRELVATSQNLCFIAWERMEVVLGLTEHTEWW